MKIMKEVNKLGTPMKEEITEIVEFLYNTTPSKSMTCNIKSFIIF
jgi:hypothetical protein